MYKFIAALSLSLTLAAMPAMAAPGKKPGELSIVGIATSPELASTFSTLVGLVVKADLAGVLDTEGQFTVFAPVNDAFLPFGTTADEVETTLEAICTTDDATSAITNILLHHVTNGRRFSNSLLGKKSPKPVEMLNGYTWISNNATIRDGAANDDAAILVGAGLYDISASNGVIHVIDTVLLPNNICQ